MAKKQQHTSPEEFEPTDSAWLGYVLLALVEDEGIDGMRAFEVLYADEVLWLSGREWGVPPTKVAWFIAERIFRAEAA